MPDTIVLESQSKALARAETRNRAAKEAIAALDAEKNHQTKILAEQKKLVFSFIPAVVFAAVIWIAVLAFGNARERKYEIGVLRSLGFQSKKILSLFLAKAAVIGFLGALIGTIIGFLIGFLFVDNSVFLKSESILLIVIYSVLFSVIAAFMPAVSATRQDPAEILREE